MSKILLRHTLTKKIIGVITVFTVFRLLTDFVCLYNYEFGLSLCKIVRSSVILLLPLLTNMATTGNSLRAFHSCFLSSFSSFGWGALEAYLSVFQFIANCILLISIFKLELSPSPQILKILPLWNWLAKCTKTWQEASMKSPLLRLLMSFWSVNKHGHHRQFLLLIGWFLKNLC
jgi:hypothetical protein